MITYLKLEYDVFGVLKEVNMKVLLGHLDWRLGTKVPRSDSADKTFLVLGIVSSVSKCQYIAKLPLEAKAKSLWN